MEYPTCFRTLANPMLGASALWPLGYSKPLWGGSKPNNRFGKMLALNHSRRSNFNRLPTELVLQICEHLSTYDLWHNIRPTSRLLAACAEEVLPRKFFRETNIHISWCCFWCSLGHHCLHATCSSITRLFPDAKSVHISQISNRALMAKVIFGNVCQLVTTSEPKIRIQLDGEERGIRIGSGEIEPQTRAHMGNSVRDLESCQHKFLIWYFAKRKKAVVRGRIIEVLGFATHLLSFFATSVVLFVVGLALALVFCTAVEVFKLLTNSYKGLKNLVRFVLGEDMLPL